MRALAPLCLLVLTLSGCTGLIHNLNGGCDARITDIDPAGWNRSGDFTVESAKGDSVQIHAKSTDGRTVQASGTPSAHLTIPDGTWAITYAMGGSDCQTFPAVRIDSKPPHLSGLTLDNVAQKGSTVSLGEGVVVEPGAQLTVIALDTNVTIAHALPFTVGPLDDGAYEYEVIAVDQAGNRATATLQVRVGAAADLPKGQYTFGVVGRYTNDLRIWDLSDPSAYLSRAAARAAQPDYLGAGLGVDPADPTVKSIVAQVVTPPMNSEQAAQALFAWMADHLKYDRSRLDATTLLSPDEVLNDHEDPNDADTNGDGIADPGPGNGVKGGVCRDLAATYVSLLRAAGVPARLVTGYLGGDINEFHAWVQFYGGSVGGLDPWVVVDVSSVGTYSTELLLQAFGIQQADHLALRDVPPSGEVTGWSNTISVTYTHPHGSTPPQVEFAKDVTPEHDETKLLCFSPDTLERRVADDPHECLGMGGHYFPDIVVRTERVIDYGVDVHSAPAGTQMTASVAFPLQDAVAPNHVVYALYGPASSIDAAAGKATATFEPGG